MNLNNRSFELLHSYGISNYIMCMLIQEFCLFHDIVFFMREIRSLLCYT